MKLGRLGAFAFITLAAGFIGADDLEPLPMPSVTKSPRSPKTTKQRAKNKAARAARRRNR